MKREIEKNLTEKKKVFVIVKEWQYDTGENGLEVCGVYSNYKKAKEKFDSEVKDAQIDFGYDAKNAGDDTTVELCENSFSIYETGEYCYNHIDIFMTEEKID